MTRLFMQESLRSLSITIAAPIMHRGHNRSQSATRNERDRVSDKPKRFIQLTTDGERDERKRDKTRERQRQAERRETRERRERDERETE